MQKNNIKVILFLFVLLGFCSCFMVNHSKREKMSYYIKQADSLNKEHRKMPASTRMTEVAIISLLVEMMKKKLVLFIC